MKNLFNLQGKNIVITGGAGVLGENIARGLSSLGSNISICDLNIERANEIASELNSDSSKVKGYLMNVMEKDSIQDCYENIIKDFEKIDILINGAGGNMKGATTSDELSFFDLPLSDLEKVIGLNLFGGAILPSQVFGNHIKDHEEGGIILNISSMNAIRPLTRIPGYSAAKAAVSNFTQWLAVHMAQEYNPKLRVNAIAPGFFLTDQNRFLLTDEKTKALTKRGQQIVDHTPMGRFGEADELLGTVVWLLSEASKFITGIVVPIDGGFSAYSGV